jgi:threonine dehydrogenase-like Zn-dependent dehydrogenase
MRQGESFTMLTTNAIAVTPGQSGSIRLVQHNVPAPGPEEILIDVIRCGICGTDREVAAGHIGRPPEGETAIILGHEVLGRVRTLGSDVSGLTPGELVTATVRRPDGCPTCQAGQVDMCQWHQYTEQGIQGLHGFLAGQIVVDQRYIIPVPAHLEETGVLIEPLTVVEKAVRQATLVQRRMAVWEPKTAIVTGAGPIGILGTLLLRSMGVDVYTVARTPAPNAPALVIEQSGAHYISTLDESIADLGARIGNVDIMLESTGASVVAFEAMQALGINGVLVLLSNTDTATSMEVPTGRINNGIVGGNKVVVGSVNSGREDFEAAAETLDVFEQHWPGLAASIITHHIPFDGDLGVILDEPKDAIKVVVEFGDRGANEWRT